MGQLILKKTAELIEEAINSLQIDARIDAVDQLERYAVEIIHWGRGLNLTGAYDILDFVRGPLFDALTLMNVLNREDTLIDVGSGGGLPGIPAAILAPWIRITLVEPRAKRAAFLRHTAYLLDLEVEIIQSREEDLLDRMWHGAVAQAVWPGAEWLRRAQRLIEPGGAVYSLTSHPLDKTDLPYCTSVELEVQCARPWDSTPRCSTRIRNVEI